MGGQKAWNKSGRSGKRLLRKVNTRDKRPRILIVCEGEKTEPYYFKGFRITSVKVEIEPAGAVHCTVVETAVKILQSDGDYEEVWCVFDRDKHAENPLDTQNFNSAMQLAKRHGINVAYSNDAFELWYLLHFNYYTSQLSRADYVTKLKKLLGGEYEKNDPMMFQKLEDKMDVAIRNAKKLYDSNKKEPAHADPTTTVFKLVERLKKLT